MADMSKHAQESLPPPVPAKSAAPAAWAVLVGMGGTSVTFNIWHATHAGRMLVPLALLYGIAPVFAAMGLSHMVAAHKGGKLMQWVTFGVMLGAMGLSIGAIAAVVGPTAGPALRWLFGAVLDAAALLALRVVLSEHEREAARSAARQAAAEAMARAALEATAGPAAGPEPGPSAGPAAGPRKRAAKDPEEERLRTAARAAYRKSKREGAALSDRALGEKYGRSRNWAASRIREAESGLRLAEAQ